MYPTKMEANGHIYEINTDYRVALNCLRYLKRNDLSLVERAMIVEILLLGENVDINDSDILQNKIQTYLRCGRDEMGSEEKLTYDYIQDETLTKTSIRQCYHFNLNEVPYLHWYEYNELIEGLTDDAIIVKYRQIRGKNPTEIKDEKERQKLIEMQEKIAIKEEHIKTKEEEQLDEFWDNIIERS